MSRLEDVWPKSLRGSRNIFLNWDAIISKQVKEAAAAQLSQPKHVLHVHFLSGLIKWVSRLESPGCTQELPHTGTYDGESSEVCPLQRRGQKK
ncbi:hypothetical protein AV530_014998 [Patagioenas fasciata monilis]|uniref:Uncharacterized protein n=1 Tax=Patagioenas fasciata monilis TaxID=372326 RepID=A0A1V4K0K0_PATFA|nr:hypothetical protein AV530_014998 [Patagioenas fasciata monilis]